MNFNASFFLLALFCAPVFADDAIEFFGGSITEHFGSYSGEGHYKTQIGDSGKLIYNPLYGVRYVNEDKSSYWSISGFTGDNSVGLPMAGAEASTGLIWLSGHFYLGLAAGAYGQSHEQYVAAGVKPFRLTNIGDTDIVPILGVEGALKMNLTDNVYAKLQETVTPLLANTILAIGFNF